MRATLLPPERTYRTETTREAVIRLVQAAPATFDDGEAERIADKAVERYLYLEECGLKICHHPGGGLRGFVLTNTCLNPHIIGQHIGSTTYNRFRVNSNYYGEENAPETIDYGFSEADLCSVFFVVQAADMSRIPGHNPRFPGSICADMKWGKKRDNAFATFATKFAAAGEIRAVNALSHGLIYLHDLRRDLYKTTLGSTSGCIDYIQQSYDVEANICPYGNTISGEPMWGARGVGGRLDCTAVCLAR